MSRLSRLASLARQALGLGGRAARPIESRKPSEYVRSRPSLWEESQPGAPPVVETKPPPVQFPGGISYPPPITPEGPPRWASRPTEGPRQPQPPKEEPFTEVELLGRDASYDAGDMQRVMQASRKVESSNVYSYYFELETATRGLLYVTFLHWEPGMASEERSGPGPTYAYYDVPFTVYKSFESKAESSAGEAVWDYLRIRGTTYGHNFRYRLIQSSGGYVPRKATFKGFARRHLVTSQRYGLGTRKAGRRKYIESRLTPRAFGGRSGAPNAAHVGHNGVPNRGRPNNGRQ